jgi:predicted RNA binding protein YcfA (HicA-like mRNA interferase family)
VAKVPTDLSGGKVRAALERAGFVFLRKKGSHMILHRAIARSPACRHEGSQIC